MCRTSVTLALEPFEEVECTVPDEYVGSIVDLLSKRKGALLDMAADPIGTPF